MQFSNVKWLKFPVELIYSSEVMSMRHARRNGKSTRDLLLCLWVELFALAGSLNENGLLLRNGTAMSEQDLADAFSRRIENIRYGLDWLLGIGMLTIDGETGAYAIPGWAETQSTEKLKAVRKAHQEAREETPVPSQGNASAEDETREEEIREEKKKEEEIREEERREDETKEDAPGDGEAESTQSPDPCDGPERMRMEERLRRERDPVKKAQYEMLVKSYLEAKARQAEDYDRERNHGD